MVVLYIITATSLQGTDIRVTLTSTVDQSLLQVTRPASEAQQLYLGRQVNVTLAVV